MKPRNQSSPLPEKPPPNVWIGTTVESQKMAEQRIPALLKIPAEVRFLSCEPLLGAVDLDQWVDGISGDGSLKPLSGYVSGDGCYEPWQDNAHRVHWVIAGGESGPGARPMHPDWARSLRDQCTAANVPFLFKQWGEWLPIGPVYADNDDNTGDPDRQIQLENTGAVAVHEGEWSSVCYQPDPRLNPWLLERVGKKNAGRLLDGVEHNDFPQLQRRSA